MHSAIEELHECLVVTLYTQRDRYLSERELLPLLLIHEVYARDASGQYVDDTHRDKLSIEPVELVI